MPVVGSPGQVRSYRPDRFIQSLPNSKCVVECGVRLSDSLQVTVSQCYTNDSIPMLQNVLRRLQTLDFPYTHQSNGPRADGRSSGARALGPVLSWEVDEVYP